MGQTIAANPLNTQLWFLNSRHQIQKSRNTWNVKRQLHGFQDAGRFGMLAIY